jgi:hypothetical protein
MAPAHIPSAKLPCMLALAAAVLPLGACGGSSSAHPATTPAGRSATGEAGAGVPATNSHDPVTNGVVTHRPLRGTGGNAVNDDNPGSADKGSATGQSDPCRLVTTAEAQAIIGKPVAAPQEAPLGPTCIYQPVGAGNFVTIAIESIDFANVKPHIRNRTSFRVSGHTAYCGDYGQFTTFVPFQNGRVLSVTAPCATGRLFAVKALSRLKT